MKQPITVLKGITYNYCEEVRFYNMIGFLNKQGEFKGIEIEPRKGIEPAMILKDIKNNDIKIVSGILDDNFDYYAMNLGSKKFSSGRLQFNGHQYSGSEILYSGVQLLTTKEELYRVIYSSKTIYDTELETMLSSILKKQQSESFYTNFETIKKKQLLKKS